MTLYISSVRIAIMLKIRLQRVGRKHEPSFRVVITDSQHSTKSGKVLGILGSYDSRRGDKAELDAEKIKYWISKGAQVSGTMHNLLISKKVIEGKKINVLSKKKPIVKEVEGEAKAAAPVAEAKPADAAAPAPEAPKA